MEDYLNKKLKNLNKKMGKITLTEAINKTLLNQDQKDLLSKKVAVTALIAELQEQLAFLATISSPPKQDAIKEALAVAKKESDTQFENLTAHMFKSITMFTDNLLTAKRLSDRHYTLLQSVQSLIASNPSDLTKQFEALVSVKVIEEEQVNEEQVNEEAKVNHVNGDKVAELEQQDSQETLGGTSTVALKEVPCFMNASEIDTAVEPAEPEFQMVGGAKDDAQKTSKKREKRGGSGYKGKKFVEGYVKESSRMDIHTQSPTTVEALNEAVIPKEHHVKQTVRKVFTVGNEGGLKAVAA